MACRFWPCFQTWKVETVNDNFPPGLNGRGSTFGSIWPDQTGSNLVHIVWSTFSDWNPAAYDIVYSNFTLDPVTKTLDWSDTYFNVTEDYATSQTNSDLYQEQDGTIHLVWSGRNGTVNDQVMYRRRQANGTWLDAVRLSGEDTWDAWEPDIVANENTGLAMAAWTSVEPSNAIRWDIVFPNNTVGTAVGEEDRGLSDSRYVSMVNDRDTNIAHMAFQEPSDSQIVYRHKSIDNSTAWSAEENVSPDAEQHSNPVIGLDEDNGTLAIVWYNQWNTRTSWEYFQVGNSPIQGKALFLTHPLRYPSMSDYYSRGVVDVTWWLAFPNGTLIGGPYDTRDEAVDAIEEIFDVNPLTPAPPSQGWPEEGQFTRFRTRFYILLIGVFMIFGTLITFAFNRPSGYEFTIGMFIILVGFSLLIAAGSV